MGSVTFALPWVLWGLISLPLLWWVLRLIPPKPLRTYFPALFLLRGLEQRDDTVEHHPWWWLLLRVMLMALLIVAAADPRWQRHATLDDSASQPLLVIVDNSWAAMPVWQTTHKHLLQTLDTALQAQREVSLYVTTPLATGDGFITTKTANPEAVRRFAMSLQPLAWPKDYAALHAALPREGLFDVLWYSDGTASDGITTVTKTLTTLGKVQWLGQEQPFPTIITNSQQQGGQLKLTLAPAQDTPHPSTIRFYGNDGTLLYQQTLTYQDDNTAAVSLPREFWQETQSFQVGEDTRLSSLALAQARWGAGRIGIIEHSIGQDGILSASYFVQNAIATFADYKLGSAATLAEADGGMIILPHDTPLAEADKRQLHEWVQAGGVLVRFAGESLKQSDADDTLLPVRLRQGIRQFSGELTWESAPTATTIVADSPLAGLPLPADIRVEQQILAAPSLTMQDHTWLTLSDGTPLITGRREGDGWLILVHTTATPAWSTLAYSEFFISFLERCHALSLGHARPRADSHVNLPPFAILDAYGRLQPPPTHVKPLDASKPRLSAATPAGLYGQGGAITFNFGENLPDIAPLQTMVSDARLLPFSSPDTLILWPYILALALVLWCMDYLLVIRLLMVASLLVVSPLAMAAQYSDQGRLAYITTGDAVLDGITAQGLASLTHILAARTSVEFAEPVGLSLDDPRLPLMPLLYWAWPDTPPTLHGDDIARLQRYLQHQGLLVIDTRQGHNPFAMQQAEQTIAGLLRQLPVQPLAALDENHVVHRAFYIVPRLHGRYDNVPVLAEQGDSGSGFVSRVIVTHHDMLAAMAVDERAQPRFILQGGERQREMVFRAGVNLVIYALTGTYKEDQVHVETLLQRMGQ